MVRRDDDCYQEDNSRLYGLGGDDDCYQEDNSRLHGSGETTTVTRKITAGYMGQERRRLLPGR